MSKISAEHLCRDAIVYIRQSTSYQVANNLESQRRQYALVDRARQLGWSDVQIVDDDLGRSGAGTARPGFEKLLAAICEGRVGAVVSLEASRLARNGRDWHTLLEFCGLVGTLIVDEDGIYDPRSINDRLLLGMKGTMSEMELSVFRQRSLEALRQKARRGELLLTVAVGYVKAEDGRIEKDPDRRVQDSIALVFRKFAELQSIRQVLLWFRQEQVVVPAVVQGHGKQTTEWKAPVLLHTAPRADQSGLCRRIRLRPARHARCDRRWQKASRARQYPSELERLGSFDPRPSRGIYFLGGVRKESASDRRQCQRKELFGPRGYPARRSSAAWSVPLRSLRPPIACRLYRQRRQHPTLCLSRAIRCQSRQQLHRLPRGSLQIPPGEVSQIPPPARQDMVIVSLTLSPGQGLQRPL